MSNLATVDRMRGHRFHPPKRDRARIPALYATEDTPLEAKIVHLHYFLESWDWWVVELGVGDDEGLAFGFVRSSLCPDGEWGLVDLRELAVQRGNPPLRQPVERDLHWDPIPFAEVSR